MMFEHMDEQGEVGHYLRAGKAVSTSRGVSGTTKQDTYFICVLTSDLLANLLQYQIATLQHICISIITEKKYTGSLRAQKDRNLPLSCLYIAYNLLIY